LPLEPFWWGHTLIFIFIVLRTCAASENGLGEEMILFASVNPFLSLVWWWWDSRQAWVQMEDTKHDTEKRIV
jgi:hypothetical protein